MWGLVVVGFRDGVYFGFLSRFLSNIHYLQLKYISFQNHMIAFWELEDFGVKL